MKGPIERERAEGTSEGVSMSSFGRKEDESYQRPWTQNKELPKMTHFSSSMSFCVIL